MNEMKSISTIASLPSSPSSSKNSREVQDARKGFGDPADYRGRRAGGQRDSEQEPLPTAPAVDLKVRVMGGIEGLQGEASCSQLWLFGGLWTNLHD